MQACTSCVHCVATGIALPARSWTFGNSAVNWRFAAAAFSAYLAYSLLVVTRMSCTYCWTGHVVNWSLIVLVWTQHQAIK